MILMPDTKAMLTLNSTKVSPDEDSEEQITSICAAVWAARVDGVVVGKSTVVATLLYSFGARSFTSDQEASNEALLNSMLKVIRLNPGPTRYLRDLRKLRLQL